MTALVVFLTQRLSIAGLKRAQKMKRDIGGRYAFKMLIDVNRRPFARYLKYRSLDDVIRFDHNTLQNDLGYPFLYTSMVPGSTHYPLLWMAQRAVFDHYILVEDDADFTGDWTTLFQAMIDSGADFCSSHPRTYAEDPAWPFWPTPDLDILQLFGTENIHKTFNTVFMLSRQALGRLDHYHRAGARGHHEQLIVSVIKRERLVFQALDRFYRGTEQNLTEEPETRSTNRHLPEVTLSDFERGFEPECIYHPVKGNFFFNGDDFESVRDGLV